MGTCGLGTCGLGTCGLGTCGLGTCGLGANGLEKIIELKLNDAEKKLLETSNQHVAKAIAECRQVLGL